MKAILLFVALVFQCKVFSQSIISGSVTESESNEILPFASVVLFQGEEQIKGTSTNVNGFYELVGIPEGRYQLTFSFLGFASKTVDVLVDKEIVVQEISLIKGINLKEIVIEAEVPVLYKDVCRIVCGYRTRCFTNISPIKKAKTEEEAIIPKLEITKLEIFPNPSLGESVTLKYNSGLEKSESIVEVFIFDLLGKQVGYYQKGLRDGKLAFQIEELESLIKGQYIVTIVDGSKQLSSKMIIQ